MKFNFLSVLKYILFLAAGILLLWLAFRNQDLGTIYNNIRKAHFGWVALSLFMSLFAFISRAYRWNMLIRPLGYNPSLRNSLYSLMVGYFANLAVPRIGEVSRCAMLGRSEKIPMDVLLGTVIAERVIDVLCLLFFTILLTVLQFETIGHFLLEKFFFPLEEKLAGNVPLLILLSTLTLASLFAAWFFLFRNVKGKTISPVRAKLKGLVNNLWQGIKTVIKLDNNWAFLAHTIIIWAVYYSVSFICFFSTDATSGLGLMEGLYALVVGGIGMSAPVQGGIGTFHFMVSEGLTLYGVPLQDGLIYATIVHASQTVFIILTGAISYFILISVPPASQARAASVQKKNNVA